MKLYPNKYYHLYNRSNNNELVFQSPENYVYFLKNYRKYVDNYLDTIVYRLMPTHFHFFVFVRDIEDIKMESTSKVDSIFGSDPVEARMMQLKNNVGILLSSYTKAINKKYARHGSLFQQHTKAIEVDDLSYLLSIITYIHQNPVRAGLVNKIEDWEFSSYRDYIGLRNGTLPKKELVFSYFRSPEDFRKHSEILLEKVERKYWIGS